MHRQSSLVFIGPGRERPVVETDIEHAGGPTGLLTERVLSFLNGID